MLTDLSAAPLILLDISRLIWRARRRGPTGIDRVELAYAQRFITHSGAFPAYGVLHLLGFLFAVSPGGGRRFVDDVAARWRGGAPTSPWKNLASIVEIYARLLASAWLIGPWLRRELKSRPNPTLFLVVSHHHLSRDYTLSRLRRRLDLKTVCFLHDLIPIDRPEYFIPGWEERYQRIARNVGRLFDAVIANSETTARSLRECLRMHPDLPKIPLTIRVAAPGVRRFDPPTPAECGFPEQPYFVILGTIEPRKNHLLLLNLWTRLASVMSSPPRLLVIGARGWENEQVVDMLERSRCLRRLVSEYNHLSDSEIAALLHQARALLSPSFAEGFGLPIAEALASGVPVICSDIPAFREVGLHTPDYLDPLDLPSWSHMVLDYCRPDSAMRAAQMKRLKQWRTPCWTKHFAMVEQLLGELCAATGPAMRPFHPALRHHEESA